MSYGNILCIGPDTKLPQLSSTVTWVYNLNSNRNDRMPTFELPGRSSGRVKYVTIGKMYNELKYILYSVIKLINGLKKTYIYI